MVAAERHRDERGADIAGLLRRLASSVRVPLGLVVDADAADPGEANGAWLDWLVTAAAPRCRVLAGGLPPGPRIALAGSPSASPGGGT